MYPNGTLLSLAAQDAELVENLLAENEQQISAEQQSAKKSVRAKNNFWSKLLERNTLVAAPEASADCGD